MLDLRIEKYLLIVCVCFLISCSDDNSQTTQQLDTFSDTNTTLDQSDGQHGSASLCGNGSVEEGETCDNATENSDILADACRTNCQEASCGDGIIDLRLNETCDDGNRIDDDGCSNLCRLSSCGDGVLQPNEACDDGPDNSDSRPNACRLNCTTARCGDAVTDSDEDCDDGNDLNDDTCLNCVSARCGDGFIRKNVETCDDKNSASLDGCSDQCRIEFGFYCPGEPSECVSRCGDGLVSSQETCDDANTNDGDYCAADCSAVTGHCGDNTIQANEICDDGNTQNGDECAANCQAQLGACGDNIVQSNETCDDGNTNSGDYCASDCQSITGFCGDDTRQSNETCDDGNTSPNDYCSINCAQITGRCGDDVLQINEICDDGNLINGDYCASDCQAIIGRCGDGLTQTTMEECDDGNTVPNDYCSSICQIIGFCGDSDIQFTEGENCDDGNSNINDGCGDICVIESGWTCNTATPSTCNPICGDGLIRGSEVCDDGNNLNGDYCSFDCSDITGYCGDLIVQSLVEDCDDSNFNENDGCVSNCLAGYGYYCTGSGCVSICGDGLKAFNEACDDANTTPGDGCNSICRIELGFICTGSPSQCSGCPSGSCCGDGLKSSIELCDDFNVVSGDGCSATCNIELGYACTNATPNVCSVFCGDGFILNPEQCDDGNNITADGCSASCTVEPGFICDNSVLPSQCQTDPNAPFITNVDYPVIAHGGRLVITGTNLAGVSVVTIGGVSQTLSSITSTSIIINSVTDSVPLGTQSVVVTIPGGTASFSVTVIHLVINEMDSDQPNGGSSVDIAEFIEISTGVSMAVNLTGYVVAFFDGSNDQTYGGYILGNTNTNGYHLAGNSGIANTQVLLANDALQNGADAVAIYQRNTVIPNSTSVVGLSDIRIDAIVYGTTDADDSGLLNNLLGPNSVQRVQVDEGSTNNSNSISRCPNGVGARNDGRIFRRTSNKTPGTLNGGCP